MMWVDRSGWHALPPNRVSPLRTATEFLVIHHSATPTPATIGAAKAHVQSIQRDHLARLVGTGPMLWADIAYGELAGPGVIFEGRGRVYRSGATGPAADDRSASLCVLGNYETGPLDDATAGTVVAWLRSCFADYGVIPVRLDREFNSTACPGAQLVAALPELIRQAQTDPEDSDMTPADVWAYPLTIEGATAPAGEWLGYLYAQIVRPNLLEQRIADRLGTITEVDLNDGEAKAIASHVAEDLKAWLRAR